MTPPPPPPKADKGETPNAEASSHVPPAEWAVAALGALLLVAALAFLTREALRGPGRPPDIVLTADTVVAGRGGWLVRVRARNVGDETAAEVTVRGTLALPNGEVTERDAALGYVPAGSARAGGLVFPADPRRGRLTLEVVGHQRP